MKTRTLSTTVIFCAAVGAAASDTVNTPRIGPSGRRNTVDRVSPPPPGPSQIAGGGVDVALGGSNESTIAVNPLDPLNVVISSLWQYEVSTNGGLTWSAPLFNTVPAPYGQCGDPTLAFDGSGRLFYGYLGCHPSGGGDIFIVELNPATGAYVANVVKVSVTGDTGPFNDKPWLAADPSTAGPYAGRLYMVWIEFGASTQVLFSRSINHGVTWSAPQVLSTEVDGFPWPAHVAVAPNGDVYIGYHSQTGWFCNPNGTSGSIVVVRSTDGGITFPQRNFAFAPGDADITFNVQNCGDGVIPNTDFWMQGSGQPWILPDPLSPGRVYVVANDDPNNVHASGDEGNVYIVRSDNSGVAWSAPLRVDHGPGTTLQVYPTAAIDPTTSCIAVMWYDTRAGVLNANGNFLLDVFYTISDDGGDSFDPDVQLNDVPFDPDLGAPSRFPGPPPTLRIGEYIGVALGGTSGETDLHGVWTGNTDIGQQAITDSVFSACVSGAVKFGQPPDANGEDLASNLDRTDMVPNVVVADDFVSDGRPITAVRWWGSDLIPNPPIDGWMISFHEPLTKDGAAAPPLGLYYCDKAVVTQQSTSLTACDNHPVLEYSTAIAGCCLVHANPDSRPPSLVPAQTDGFHEQECFAYDIDIQAVIGRKYVNSGGTCIDTLTGNSAVGNVWGWHSTAIEHGLRSALQSMVSMSGPNWSYDPWANITPTCSQPNMAFQLLTDIAGGGDCNDNGMPDACESIPDCQPNGVFDECDIAGGFSRDCDTSGIPDECEIASDPDCNGNAVLDVCDNKDVGRLSGEFAAVLGFVEISATGTPLNLGDDDSVNVTMPFTTAAFGGPTISVANNGGVGLVPNTGLGAVDNWPLPHVNAFGGNAGMLVYWDDFDSTTGNVYHQTVGVTPSQTFIVQWHNRPHFAGDLVLDGDEATFQVQIFESPVGGVLAQYLYTDTNFLNAAFNNGASATVGYQRSATSAIQWSLDTAGAVTSGMVISLLAGDRNNNGRPDDCDPAPPLTAGPPNRNRNLGLSAAAATAGPGAIRALRVTMVDLQNPVPPNLPANPPPDFSAYEAGPACTDPSGCVRWVGPPNTFLESQDSPGSGNYQAARLQCTPHYQDWSAAGLFYITGAEIAPSSTYDVHSFAASCETIEATCIDFSPPLRLTTARSGDVQAPFNPPSTTTQPDALDVATVVNKLKNLPGAPLKAVTQLQPNLTELNADINALDIVAVVDAVKQKAYAFSGPCPCPSLVTCESLACPAGPAPCVTAFGPGALCVKTCSGGGPNDGLPCINNTHCPSGTCGSPFCRDACGRCSP